MADIVELTLHAKNARLRETRRALGISQPQMAQKLGMCHLYYLDIENLRRIPKPEIQDKISCILVKPADWLFPESLLDAIKAGVFDKRKKNLDDTGVKRLTYKYRLDYDGETKMIEDVDRELLVGAIQEAITVLSPRQREVIMLHHGLAGNETHTFAEIGAKYGCSKERIRQIHYKALKILRHPHNSRALKRWL